MPDQGRLTEDLVTHTSPVVSPAYPPPPWSLPRAQVLKVVYETDADAVLAWLPPKLTRSTPPYATVTVEHYPESPVGSFSVAHQLVGCRAGFFIRAFALQSIVDNAVALVALRELWGFPAKLGEITMESTRDSACGLVKLGGKTLLAASMSAGRDIEPDLVRFDPVLTLRLVPSLQPGLRHDLVQLLQIDPELMVRDAVRGAGKVEYASEGNDRWSGMPHRSAISSTFCTVDTELPLARFVMPY
jgi:acetoacetate decarboxylase